LGTPFGLPGPGPGKFDLVCLTDMGVAVLFRRLPIRLAR
jgi:hypothetical protein